MVDRADGLGAKPAGTALGYDISALIRSEAQRLKSTGNPYDTRIQCFACDAFPYDRSFRKVRYVIGKGRDVYLTTCPSCTRSFRDQSRTASLDAIGVSLADADALMMIYDSSRNSAAKRGINHDLTVPQFCTVWARQGGKCALTGREMHLHLIGQGQPDRPSLDRIHSGGGYRADNVHFVCSIVNRMKNDLTMAEFLEWSAAVASGPAIKSEATEARFAIRE